MNPRQALQLLDKLRQEASAPGAVHEQLILAVQTLARLVERTEEETTKDTDER